MLWHSAIVFSAAKPGIGFTAGLVCLGHRSDLPNVVQKLSQVVSTTFPAVEVLGLALFCFSGVAHCDKGDNMYFRSDSFMMEVGNRTMLRLEEVQVLRNSSISSNQFLNL